MAENEAGGGGTPLERDAQDKIDTVKEMFSTDPPPAPPPPAPPPPGQFPVGTPAGDNQLAKQEAKEGCAKALSRKTLVGSLVALITAILIIGAVTIFQDEETCKSSGTRRDGLQLIACVPPDSSSNASASSESTASEGEASTDSNTGLPAPNPNVVSANPNDKAMLGGPASDGAFATPQSAPAGAILFQGSSGDQVGFIAQDGAFRYVSLEHPGVGVGEGARPGLELVWTAGDGVVTEFGIRTFGGTNSGRYGFNPYANGGTYLHGCALEVGQTACKRSAPSEVVVHNGDRVVIQVGEAGHLDEVGDFTFEWWFVFQPS